MIVFLNLDKSRQKNYFPFPLTSYTIYPPFFKFSTSHKFSHSLNYRQPPGFYGLFYILKHHLY